MKNEKGFTLIEMMIVLLIISVLLIITIPNIANHSANIDKKGCEAYIKMVEAQVQAYKMENNKYPTDLAELESGGYLKGDKTACSADVTITIGANGEVITDPEL
ncbi:competence type IV pilus major pilin ComGC [Bacillus marasmi]|uniref:competence type IV pilus major pilin ComGC n=1 Tax=Bacillus marasmi TaxID=1926279 RepID=UPI0011CA8E72|nr:competence type IV pilus major pilin ComGC [Bacillus marasmi]